MLYTVCHIILYILRNLQNKVLRLTTQQLPTFGFDNFLKNPRIKLDHAHCLDDLK